MTVRDEYRRQFTALNEEQRRRFFIAMAEGTREEYLAVEEHLKGLADDEKMRVFRDVWRPA